MIELVCPAYLGHVGVNKIIQAQGTVVLGAVVEGGVEDSDDDDDGQYQSQVSILMAFHLL